MKGHNAGGGRRGPGASPGPLAWSGSRASPRASPAASYAALFLGAWSSDRELLDDLVVAPLLRVFIRDLKDEVERLLAIALGVEGDLAGDPVVLHLADRSGDVLAARHLAALGRGLDGLQRDRGGVVGLGRIRLGVLAELLLEVLDEALGAGQRGGGPGGRGVVHADHGLAGDLRQIRGVHAVGAHELGLDALLARLLEERRAL